MPYEKIAEQRQQLTIGLKQTLKAMEEQKVIEVFIAEDVDAHIKDKVVQLARHLNISYEVVDSKRKLGAACGISVSAATVAITYP